MSFSLSLSSFKVTVGESFSFDITPLSALAAAEDVTWEIIGIGRYALVHGDIRLPSGDYITFPSGTVSFDANASAAKSVQLLAFDDNYNFAKTAKTFIIRLTQGDEVLAQSEVITLADDYAANRAADRLGTSHFTSHKHENVFTLGTTQDYKTFSGRDGSDTYIITKYQSGDIKITDISGGNTLKLDFDVVVTQISYDLGRGRLNNMFLTLDTGAQIHVMANAIRDNFEFQIGDGELLSYKEFHDIISAGGIKASAEDAKTKERGFLETPFEVTESPSETVQDTKFSVSPSLTKVTVGESFSFDITPLSALAAAEDVTWEIIGIGRYALVHGDIRLPSGDYITFPSGTVSFDANASAAKSVQLLAFDDNYNFAKTAKTFIIRLTQGDEVLAQSEVITLADDYAANRAADRLGTSHFTSHKHENVFTLGTTQDYKTFSGRDGSDTYIITKYQSGDIKITDISGGNTLKLDFDVVVTQISYDLGRGRLNNMFLTLDTGAQIHVMANAIRDNFEFQIGDGELLSYKEFHDIISAGGIKASAEDAKTKERGFLETPFEVTKHVTFSSDAQVSISEDATSLSHQIASPAHGIESYALSGTDAASFTISDSGVLSLASGVTLDADGGKTSYAVTVTITLLNGRSGSQDITVTVTDVNDTDPVFASDTPTSITFDEHSDLPNTVFVATGDVGTVVYSLSGTDQSAFTIDSATGQLSAAKGTFFDFETTASYSFNVVATVGQRSTSHAVTVTLNDVEDPPIITSGDSLTAWPENTAISKDTALYAATGTVRPGKPAIAWSLKAGADDSDLFEISETGSVSLKEDLTPDFEGKSSYSFTVVATSDNLSAERTVTIAVTDVADATHFTSPATVTIPENTQNWSHKLTVVPEKATDTVTYALLAFGNSPFRLDGDTIMLRDDFAGFDFEGSRQFFTAFVTATDSSGNAVSQTFRLNITNVDEAPTAQAGIATLDRELGYNFKASDFNKGFSDPENANFDGITLTQLPDETAGILRLNGTAVTANQILSVADLAQLTFTLGTTAVPAAHDVSFSYQVKAADSTVNSEAISFTLSVPAIPKPVFTRPVTSLSVEERADSIGLVQYFANAQGHPITFSLTGANRDKFKIDADGVVTRASDAHFLKSDGAELTFNVVATSRGVSAEVAVKVTITDIANNTFIKVPTNPTILYSSDDDDTITGTSGSDILYGDGGDDVITAGGGGDIIIGGYGSDEITLHDQDANDQVIYRFDSSNKKSWQAVDGSDVIANFAMTGAAHRDTLLLVDVGNASDVTSHEAFITGLIAGGGSFTVLENAESLVTGIRVSFAADGTDDGTSTGTSTGNDLTIMFNGPLSQEISQTVLLQFESDRTFDKSNSPTQIMNLVELFESLNFPFEFTKDVTPSGLSFDTPLAFTKGPQNLTTAEHVVFQGQTYKAVSDDGDATITYSLASTEVGGTDHNSFSVSSDGILTAAAGVQFDLAVKSSYAITIKASDGSHTAIREVVITVTGGNAGGSFAGASKAETPPPLEHPLPLDELELPLYAPSGEI